MSRKITPAIFEGLEGMPNRSLYNTMKTGFTTFIEGIADSGTDPFVKLDEINTAWKPTPDNTDPEAFGVFMMISNQKPKEQIGEVAKGHEGDPDFGTKDIGYGITWKDIADWSKRDIMQEGIGKKLAPLALAGAVGLGAGIGIGPKVHETAHNIADSAKKEWRAAGNFNSAMNSASKWNASSDLLGNWKYVDVKDKPGIYSDSLNHTSLSELQNENSSIFPSEKIKVGWKVSPDGKTIMSTITGRVYKTNKSFFDPSFTAADLGKPVGVGVLYIDKSLEDSAFPWDVEALYGK